MYALYRGGDAINIPVHSASPIILSRSVCCVQFGVYLFMCLLAMLYIVEWCGLFCPPVFLLYILVCAGLTDFVSVHICVHVGLPCYVVGCCVSHPVYSRVLYGRRVCRTG